MKKVKGILVLLLMIGVLVLAAILGFFALGIVAIVVLALLAFSAFCILFKKIFKRDLPGVETTFCKKNDGDCVVEEWSIDDSIDQDAEIIDVKEYEEL